jgi:hypothetical protein
MRPASAPVASVILKELMAYLGIEEQVISAIGAWIRAH